MSFGVGVGDIILVADIATKVRKRFVDSPDQFKAVSDEVKSLSNVLRDLEDVIPERNITDQQKTDLEEALQVCRNTLTALDQVLDKYHDLAPPAGRNGLAQKSRRLWKRLTFEPEDVSNLRLRLTSNISLFNAFVGSLALGVSHATKAGVDRLNTYQSKEQYLKVLDWLSSTDLPTQQNEIYKDCQEGTGQWLLKSNEYLKWIDGVKPILFCPDALDECIDSRTRLKLLKAVTALQTQQAQQTQQRTVQFLTTSRSIPEIVEEFDGKPTIEIRADDGDIRRYLEHHLENLSLCVQRNQSLQAEIVTEISRAVDGMFLLAQLHLSSLYDKITTKAVKLALQQLPKGSQGLDMAYDKTIERIDDQQPGFRQLAKQTLSWIVYATRPLSVLELRHALAVEDEATELDKENLAETDEIIRACAGLVTVEQETKSIRLVHYTTQEYLEHKFLTWEPLAEEAIVRTCLTYLSFDVFKTDLRDMNSMFWQDKYERKLKRMYLLRYAIDTWHNHAKRCWNDVVERLVFSFLEENSQILHYDAQVYLRKYGGVYQKLADVTGFKSIHFAALFDLARLVPALLQAGYNTRVVDRKKRTPLTYAAEFGHEAVAELMLRDAGICDENGYTPLHFASENGNESIVKLLLNYEGIDMNAQDFLCHDTPLNLAIENGHKRVVRLLLERDEIDVSRGPFGNRKTALMSCAISGSDGVLQQLLKRNDVDLNCKNDRGETALMLAIQRGNTKVFKRLLRTPSVEVHHKYHKNITLLILAVSNYLASEDLVELILNRKDIDVNCKDEDGRTALMWNATTTRGNASADYISRRLLERKELDVNCQDKNGRTALMMAVRSNFSVVERLLEREELEVNFQDNEGRTALMMAVGSENFSVVERLLEREELEVNFQDNEGRTALMIAADGYNGWKIVSRLIEKLLERRDINVNCQDKKGRTALMRSSILGDYRSVKRFFEREELDVNCQNNEGKTALMLAATVQDKYGNPASVIQKFLERRDIDVNCQDNNGQTALMLAASCKNHSVVDILLERDDIDRTGYDLEQERLRENVGSLGSSS
ncbi:MAG: hypothetical protein Q9195_006966 [Heterodermia aff. obscurata]